MISKLEVQKVVIDLGNQVGVIRSRDPNPVTITRAQLYILLAAAKDARFSDEVWDKKGVPDL